VNPIGKSWEAEKRAERHLLITLADPTGGHNRLYHHTTAPDMFAVE
jgi:hypothetical protein